MKKQWVTRMPSDAFNDMQAQEVMDGVLDVDECEDPGAVMDILDEEYASNPYNINYQNDYTRQKEKKEDGKIWICCLAVVILFIIFILLF